MHAEQRQRTTDLLRAKGLSQALFADLNSITWLTGFAPPRQLGPNLFAGGPSLLWVDDGHYTLIVLDSLAPAAGALADEADCDLVLVPGYTIEEAIDGPARLRRTLQRVVSESGVQSTIGLEIAALPAALNAVLSGSGMTDPVAVDGWLTRMRMVKTGEELAKLEANFALTEVGHAAARAAVGIGLREIDIWTEVHGAIQRAAGQRVPLGNDCTAGFRQFNIGAWPEAEELGPQDSIIIDLSTVLHGYWSDSCVTYVAGEPTAEQRQLHKVISETLDFAIGLVRPGVMAKTIDRKVRDFIDEAGYPVYPHHTGHGVGVTGHEEPRIVPYNEEVLQEGMVIMLEPGIYFPGRTGVRLEDAMLVTADGAKVLTGYDKSL